MKKALLAIPAIALCAAMSATPVFAATATQDTAEGSSTAFTFEYQNDPTYTITIPDAVSMDADGTQVNITAENVANLGDKKISVTIAGTDQYRNQMVMTGKTEDGMNVSMRYQFVLADGSVIETTGGKDQANGVELASFTEDGTGSYTVKPVLAFNVEKGVTYTGSLTYGIELVDLA